GAIVQLDRVQGLFVGAADFELQQGSAAPAGEGAQLKLLMEADMSTASFRRNDLSDGLRLPILAGRAKIRAAAASEMQVGTDRKVGPPMRSPCRRRVRFRHRAC